MSKKEVRLSQAAKLLLSYIEQNPKYAHLVEEAKKNSPRTRQQKRKWAKLLHKLVGLVVADPKNFHGTAFVSEDLAKQANLTAGLVTVSSAFNFVTNYPLFAYAFGTGFGALVLTALSNQLILKYTNDSTTAVSGLKKNNRAWQKQAIAASLFINAFQSLLSGVGTELLLNQSGLSQIKALERIQQQVQQIETLKIDSPQYKDALDRCQAGERELTQLDKNHPRRDSLFVQLYGRWSERDAEWQQTPLENLPVCRQVERLRQEAYKGYETAKKNIDRLLVIRSTMGNDVAFLKQEMPLLYQQDFTPSGEIASGTEATRIAILSLWKKLQSGDLAGLGFPLFMLVLSAITSGFACTMTIAFAAREDAQKSFNDAVKLQRDFWLEQRREELLVLLEAEVVPPASIGNIQPGSEKHASTNGNHLNT